MLKTSLSEKKIGLLVWQVSNFWQTNMRNILKNYNISLNEYLILETIYILLNNLISPSQKITSDFSGIDVSVVSVCLKSLENKKLVKRLIDKDIRKKVISILPDGYKIFNKIFPRIIQQEKFLFDKLQNEKVNFCNSLRLILGKKLRIKARKNL